MLIYRRIDSSNVNSVEKDIIPEFAKRSLKESAQQEKTNQVIEKEEIGNQQKNIETEAMK